ncbi:MAG: DnaJ domain-containing protein [Faecalibacterium sp.]|jgi:molecular chaperone DnaJ|nr:DnaJ domain-containing protein [Faecalibacterium sp.]
MRDPYQVLGIQRGATEDEIKKAYRAQCKRWHPDLNPNDPTAEEHFKEVQEAYDAIVKGDTQASAYGNPYAQRQASQQAPYGQNAGWADEDDPFGFGDLFGSAFGGYSQQSYGSNPYTGRQTTYTTYPESDSAELQAARNFIASRHYTEARRVLDGIAQRGARWYYLSALASQGLGRAIDALADARRAYELEPNNMEYRSLYSQLQNPSGAYRQQSRGYAAPFSFGRWCFSLILLNLFCQCFSGGCCRGTYFGPGYYM